MNIQDLAGSLFQQVQKSIPLTADKVASRRAPDVDRALERLHGEVRKLRETHHLGIITSARMLLELQRRLLAAGYPPELVRKLIYTMILQLFSGKK